MRKIIFELVYFFWGLIAPFFLKLFFKKRCQINNIISKDLKIWVHASSVGELKILDNISNDIKKRYNIDEFLVTVFTNSGYNEACKRFNNVIFFPIETSYYYKKIIKHYQIEKVIILETEIWPILLYTCNKLGVDVNFINFYISEKSYKNYKRLFDFLPFLKNSISKIVTKDKETYNKAKKIGFKNIIEGTDLKLKYEINKIYKDDSKRRFGVFVDDKIGIFVSLRPNEETIWLKEVELFDRIIIAPRYLDDGVGKLIDICIENSISYQLYSDIKKGVFVKEKVIIVDMFGVLDELFKISDVAVVGGTFVDAGGHNIMEPVKYLVPVIYGPSVYKQIDSNKLLLSYKAGICVKDIQGLYDETKKLLNNRIYYLEVIENQKIMIDKLQTNYYETLNKIFK